jgi:hypothetical protein
MSRRTRRYRRRSGHGRSRRSRLQSGEEGCALLLTEVVDDHRVMRGQGAGTSEKLLDRKLKALALAWLNGLGGHLAAKRRSDERRGRQSNRAWAPPPEHGGCLQPTTTCYKLPLRPRPGREMLENYGQRRALTVNKTAGQSTYWLLRRPIENCMTRRGSGVQIPYGPPSNRRRTEPADIEWWPGGRRQGAPRGRCTSTGPSRGHVGLWHPIGRIASGTADDPPPADVQLPAGAALGATRVTAQSEAKRQ